MSWFLRVEISWDELIWDRLRKIQFSSVRSGQHGGADPTGVESGWIKLAGVETVSDDLCQLSSGQLR